MSLCIFDVPKVVRSPGCDHGHDEESRNGRDVKIDIWDDYIRTPEVFRTFSEKTGVPEGYRNPPGELMGHMGLSGKREGGRPPLLVLFGPREGRGARPILGCPFLFSTKAHKGPDTSRGVPVTSR